MDLTPQQKTAIKEYAALLAGVFLFGVVMLLGANYYVQNQEGSPVSVPGYIDPALVESGKAQAPALTMNLGLELATQKYIRLEPIFASLNLKETSPTAYEVAFPKSQCAGAVDIVQVEAGGVLKRIGGSEFCFPARARKHGLFDRWWSWKLRGVSRRYWLKNDFSPGKVTLRAVLTLWEPRVQFVTNDVTIDVREPAGLDLEAYNFLNSGEPINLNGEAVPLTALMESGFLRGPDSAKWEKAHRAFVAQYPNSLYAAYIRYTIAANLSRKITEATEDQWEDAHSNHLAMMTEITQTAPAEFPWLAHVYYHMMRHYKMRQDTAKFDELKAEVLRKGVDLDVGQGIRRLLEVEPCLDHEIE